MSKRVTIIKSGIWYTISNYLIKGMDFLTIPIFTRLLSVNEYGAYNNFVSCLQVIFVIGSVCIDASLISARFDYKDKLVPYIKTALICGNIATLLLGVVSFFCQKTITILFSIDSYMMFLIFLYCLFRPSLDVFQQIERFNYHYKVSVAVSAISSVLSVIISFILIAYIPDKLYARILGAYAPLIVISFIFYCKYIFKKEKFKVAYAKYAMKICIPYIPHSLAVTILSSTDRIMINYFQSTKEVAYYSIAYTCGIAMSIFATSLNSAFAPWLGEKINSNSVKGVNNVCRKYIAVFLVPLFFVSIISPEILLVLGGQKYLAAKYVIPPVIISCYIQLIYSLFVNVEQFAKRTAGMAVISVIAAIINIGLNIWFLPGYGYMAAAYTTLISYICLMLMHYITICRIGYKDLYDIKFILLTLIVFGIFVFTMVIFYEMFLVRIFILIICIFIFLSVCIKYRNKIILLIKGDNHV